MLKFNERGYQDPFYQQSMSDGTLKMFAYLLLLEEPGAPSVHRNRGTRERTYTIDLLSRLPGNLGVMQKKSRGKIQALLTTHSPQFVDALALSKYGLWKRMKMDLLKLSEPQTCR